MDFFNIPRCDTCFVPIFAMFFGSFFYSNFPVPILCPGSFSVAGLCGLAVSTCCCFDRAGQPGADDLHLMA